MKKDKNAEKIIELEQKIGELTAGWQRTQADFQNFRRQNEDERKKLTKMANSNLILDILPVLDNFRLAARHVPDELQGNNWTQGIKQIEKQLENILESEGLTRIESVGAQFDPNLHEAIDHVQSDRPENEIVEELMSGYVFDNTVLRPAKVKVSSGEIKR